MLEATVAGEDLTDSGRDGGEIGKVRQWWLKGKRAMTTTGMAIVTWSCHAIVDAAITHNIHVCI